LPHLLFQTESVCLLMLCVSWCARCSTCLDGYIGLPGSRCYSEWHRWLRLLLGALTVPFLRLDRLSGLQTCALDPKLCQTPDICQNTVLGFACAA
jgi:hypothetical protein